MAALLMTTMMIRLFQVIIKIVVLKSVCAVLLMVLFALPMSAQTNDLENWYGLAFSRKVSNGFTAVVASDIRFNDNGSRFKKLQADIGAEYKVNKWFKTALCYRYTRFNNYPKYYRNENSFFADLKFDKSLSRFNFNFRARFQDIFYQKEDQTINQFFSRNKFLVEYDIYQSRFMPWASYELAFLLFDPATNGSAFDKYRGLVGIKYTLNRTNSFNVFYGLQHSYDETEDVNSYILGVDFTHKF